VRGATGLRLHSVSGDVNRPGVYGVPFGLTLGELIGDRCGGVSGGRPLKAVATSGPSGGFLPATLDLKEQPPAFVENLVKRGVVAAGGESLDLLSMPLDPDLFRPFPQFMLGAAIVVYGSGADMAHAALNCVEFFRNESCGKCVPCRLGSQKLVQMLRGFVDGAGADWGLFDELAETMFTTSICGLGQVAPTPIRSVMKYFPEDLQRYAKL